MATGKPGLSFYKILRLVIVIGLLSVMALMLRKPPAPAPPIAAEKVAANTEQFNAKLEELKSATEHGESGKEVGFTSDEVNSFIADASARAQQPHPIDVYTPPTRVDEEPVRAAIIQTQLAFEGNEVVAQAVVQRYGQDIVVTVRGTLGVQGGYLKFTPTGFKIGSLAVPVSMVGERLAAKLAEPENREKFKLPDFISDLRIQNGQLKIVQK